MISASDCSDGASPSSVPQTGPPPPSYLTVPVSQLPGAARSSSSAFAAGPSSLCTTTIQKAAFFPLPVNTYTYNIFSTPVYSVHHLSQRRAGCLGLMSQDGAHMMLYFPKYLAQCSLYERLAQSTQLKASTTQSYQSGPRLRLCLGLGSRQETLLVLPLV